MRPRLAAALALIAVMAGDCGVATAGADASDAPEGASAESAGAEQPGADLERLRGEIAELEERVRSLEARKVEARAERERLETELALASLRVREGEAERRRHAQPSRGDQGSASHRAGRLSCPHHSILLEVRHQDLNVPA